MFEIGDKVAYPMHGAGIIEGVENKRILGQEHKYFILKLTVGNIKVMLPISNVDEIGIRYIVTPDEADKVISGFKNCSNEGDNNWNKRYKDNISRKMYNNAKNILISELVLSKNSSYEDIERLLDIS